MQELQKEGEIAWREWRLIEGGLARLSNRGFFLPLVGLVVSIGPFNYSLNHAKIIHPDLFPNLSNVAVTCQGTDRLLDFSSILSNVPRNSPGLAVSPSTPSAAP
ncbi:hypothetical protein KP509_04G036100 [Ceratopteris richardii]|uniref:Uncharacterized protein n=1 Tax=Ceratopteris richardii TaxID=49495 RepID=A0A8T2UZE9_CERRI|nr:hypothetical protein KP509_04G036100 [Ceratopteris richardii]